MERKVAKVMYQPSGLQLAIKVAVDPQAGRIEVRCCAVIPSEPRDFAQFV